MKHGKKVVLGIALVLAVGLPLLHAQDEDCEDDCKINSNLAMAINEPLKSTGQVASIGWGTVAGVGYNFNKRHAFIGEFMWNRTYPTGKSLQPLGAGAVAGNLDGSTDLYMVTGNYRFELRGRLFGAYLIGGGGLYIRNTNLSATVRSGSGTVCTPAWLWWGFTCTSGTVDAGQTLTSSTSIVLGGNGGGGVTLRVGNAPYRFYTEARYHYAPTEGLSTHFVAVTLGFRY